MQSSKLPCCLDNLRVLTFPHAQIALGFLESDSQDGTFAWLKEILPDLQSEFSRVALLKRDSGFQMVGERWEVGNQRKRREILAQSRKYLLSRSLQEEDWVLWLDVDVQCYPLNVIEQLLESGKEIAVPNCVMVGMHQQFDLNTYKLKPTANEIDWRPYIVDGLLQPPAGIGLWYLNDLELLDAIEIDAVGGAMLLVRTDLHREVWIFPHHIHTGSRSRRKDWHQWRKIWATDVGACLN